MTFDVVATRGDRLILNRSRIQAWDQRHDLLDTEVIGIIEVDADERLARRVVFDTDDIEGAFTELEARYLAGEAAAYAPTWSAVLESFSALNRHELPSAPLGLVAIDHRQGPSIAPDELMKFLRAGWNLTPDFHMCIEAVHHLSNLGAVITVTAQGTSPEGFEADWRMVELLWKDSGAGHRIEVFDETDLDAALARFEELQPIERRLENTATRVSHCYAQAFASRNWNAVSEQLADDFTIDDRRRTVNGGIRHGRGAAVEDLQAAASVGFVEATGTVLATRGTGFL